MCGTGDRADGVVNPPVTQVVSDQDAVQEGSVSEMSNTRSRLIPVRLAVCVARTPNAWLYEETPMKNWLYASVLLVVGLGVTTFANAAYVETPLPAGTYISLNGFDWAWAYPLPASASGFDLSYQSQFGWRIPTASELTLAPLATDFLIPGGNVPYGSGGTSGTDPVSGAVFHWTNAAYDALQSPGAVAVPYFSTDYYHADWHDGLGQTYGPWAGMPGAQVFADQLVIRGSGSVIPEPATMIIWSLLGSVGLAAAWRRKRAV
jgi:hypothetical protein